LKGRKSGEGFYLHKGKSRSHNPLISQYATQVQSKLGLKPRTMTDGEIVDRLILIMVNEAAKCLEEGVIERPGYLDIAMVMGTGFPAFRGGY